MVHISFKFMLILDGSIQVIKKQTETLVVASKEIGLEVNADKTKEMVMSQDQNAGRVHSKKTDKNGQQKFFP